MRTFMMAALAVAWLTCARPIDIARAAGERPNIIYVMADDLGWGDVGCFGQKHIQTPNIDRLASQGTRFTDVYAGASVCAPSRSVLMTGQHTGHTRVRGNSARVGGVSNQRRVPLETDDVTVAEVLKSVGYTTGITGKWGLGEPDTTGVPNRQGFDQWFGYLNQQHAHNHFPEYLWRNEERVDLLDNFGLDQGQYSHDLMTEFALDFVRQNEDQPFFLYMAYTLPHGDYMIPSTDPYSDRDWERDYIVHAAMVTRLDRDMGRLMKQLDELSLDEKTIVFFCSDNGAVARREGVLDSAGPFRGNKGNMYEGGLRTPMIVRWPGHVAAGRVDDTPWYFADVLPTLAELAGATPPSNIDGVSVLPTILGQDQDLSDRMLYWEQYSGDRLLQAVRFGNWKLHRQENPRKVELYDLANDVAETRNVADQHPEIVERSAAYMDGNHTPSPYWPVGSAAEPRGKARGQAK